MRVSIWRSMNWSTKQSRPGLVVFFFEPRNHTWRCTGADLYTEDRVYYGHWYRESMQMDLIHRVEKAAYKAHGDAKRRQEGDSDPLWSERTRS